MTRDELHIAFRTLGQQMGLQHIRGILPESIDMFLNVAQNEFVRTLINTHTAAAYREKISQKDNSISPINSLKTIYKQKNLTSVFQGVFISRKTFDYTKYVIDTTIADSMLYTSISISYDGKDYIHCRLVNGDDVDKTIDDYCNTVSRQYPIVSIFGDTLHIYAGSNLNSVVINYIKQPNKIEPGVDCEIPEHLQYNIVELAVNKFLNAVRNTSN